MDIAYLIVEKQNIVVDKYLNSMKKNNYFCEYYNNLRKYFFDIDPNNYKGISRNVLYSVPKKIKELFDDIPEPDAQYFMDEILEKYENDEVDLIYNLQDCLAVYNKINGKQNYEIIMSIKDENNKSFEDFLGYDIGYFGGDNFSIISDSILLPMWHGAPENAYPELKPYLKLLNKNLLFNKLDEAREFKEYYLGQKWAEKDDNDIFIQKILSIKC